MSAKTYLAVECRETNTLDLYCGGEQTTVLACLDHDPSVGIFGDPEGSRALMAEIVAALNGRAVLLAHLTALTDWLRQHTSPRDPNTPHALIVAAMHAIETAQKEH